MDKLCLPDPDMWLFLDVNNCLIQWGYIQTNGTWQKVTLPTSYSYDESTSTNLNLYPVFSSVTGIDVPGGASTTATELETGLNPRTYKTNSFFHIGLNNGTAAWWIRWITIGYCET